MDAFSSSGCVELLALLGSAIREWPAAPLGPDPLAVCITLMLAVSAGCWVAYFPTDNLSHVDRWWSIGPPVYVLICAWRDLAALAAGRLADVSPRMLIMTALALMWGARLTYNFWRRDGYSSLKAEDYRWVYVRKLSWLQNPIALQIFNLFAVALWQNLLLLAIVAPAYVAATLGRAVPLQPLDLAAAALFTLFLCGETAADQQQYAFQTEKYRRIGAGVPLTGDYARGFLTAGLWRYSRHPNFFCEQAMWWTYTLFAVAASGCTANILFVGPFSLSLLFQGSTWLTELITSGKYPRYQEYQKTTSQLVPWFPRAKAD